MGVEWGGKRGIVSSSPLLRHSSIFATFADVLILDHIGKSLYLRIYYCFQLCIRILLYFTKLCS